MPVMDGLEATRRILEHTSEGPPRVLMLTTFDLDEYVYDALRAGASGFLLKDAPAEELVHAVRVVAAGDALVSPSVMRRLIADFVAQPQRGQHRTGRARRPHSARARGPRPGCPRPLQRRDQHDARRRATNNQDARRAHPPQAPPTRPRPSCRSRLRIRPHRPRRIIPARRPSKPPKPLAKRSPAPGKAERSKSGIVSLQSPRWLKL